MKLSVVLLNLLFLNFSFALVNVLEKDGGATFCLKHGATEKLFDGYKGKDNPEAFSQGCGDEAFLEVKVKEKVYIHYIVLYKGDGPNYHQLKYFVVQHWRDDMYYQFFCEHFSNSVPLGQATRVNCAPRQLTDWIKIISHLNYGIYLSEIEAYYLGENPKQTWVIHKGCFNSFSAAKELKDTTLDRCASTCRLTHSYFGMKKGTECNCGNTYEFRSLSGCNITCADSYMYICGGENSYSVYMVNFRLPYYEGCFNRRDLNTPVLEANDMTIGKCLKHCEPELLAWLSDGKKCQCSNDRGYTNLIRFQCSAGCKGDSETRCGSAYNITIFSLWRGCTNPSTRSLKCSAAFECAEGTYNHFGICIGPCKLGFTGEHCLDKSNPKKATTMTTTASITRTPRTRAPLTRGTTTRGTTTRGPPTRGPPTRTPSTRTLTTRTPTTRSPSTGAPTARSLATGETGVPGTVTVSNKSRGFINVIYNLTYILNQFIIMLIGMNN